MCVCVFVSVWLCVCMCAENLGKSGFEQISGGIDSKERDRK